MRALILVLTAAVIVLAALILGARPDEVRRGPVFEATRLIADARPGETATYQNARGESLTYTVEVVVPGASDRPPRIRIQAKLQDRLGKPVPGGSVTYDHWPSRHGLFPLTAPQDPDGFDRVWVWERIQRKELTWQGRPRAAWKVELVDPALPDGEGADHVVAWLDSSVPVFGLLAWTRGGQTWTLVSSEGS